MKTFKISGADLACEERGTGELLILVHGAVGDYRTWEGVLDTFAARHRVITYSRRWHHPETSAGNGAGYTHDSHAADLIELITSCGGGPVRLLGHSYSASVCAVVAVQRPDLVRSLVLAEPSLFSLLLTRPMGAIALAQTAAAMMHITPLMRKGQPEQALTEFLKAVIGPAGFERLPERARAVMFANVHTLGPMLNGMSAGNSFSAKQAARINAPTLLVEGELTTKLFQLTMKELAGAIPNAERTVVPGVGHGLHLETPDAFSGVALDFFSRH
ncbi:MAG: alpha/beta hydrolase [Verrucomicrobia bacterium]|jgi:pimeloyl-ACP methyl ester carboxylesterase|nr:alpha/beta hydrolase [Verrucomicrobiota bacterium]